MYVYECVYIYIYIVLYLRLLITCCLPSYHIHIYVYVCHTALELELRVEEAIRGACEGAEANFEQSPETLEPKAPTPPPAQHI